MRQTIPTDRQAIEAAFFECSSADFEPTRSALADCCRESGDEVAADRVEAMKIAGDLKMNENAKDWLRTLRIGDLHGWNSREEESQTLHCLASELGDEDPELTTRITALEEEEDRFVNEIITWAENCECPGLREMNGKTYFNYSEAASQIKMRSGGFYRPFGTALEELRQRFPNVDWNLVKPEQ